LNCQCTNKKKPDVEIDLECVVETASPRFKIIKAANEEMFCNKLEESIIEGYEPISDLKVSVPFEGDSNCLDGYEMYSMLLEKQEIISIPAPSIFDEGINIQVADLYLKIDEYLLNCELAKKNPSTKDILRCILDNEVNNYE
jgi:hypothetical protein